MKLVDVFVDLGMVLESMNPVDPRIREEEEGWDREDSVSPSIIRYIFIEAPVPPHFSEEPWEGHEGHPRESNHRGPNFHPDLSLDEPRVLHHVVVEEEEVRQRREGEVHAEDSHEGEEVEGDGLTEDVVSRPC